MEEKYKDQYRIPSARAQWHDYNEGSFFVTICTKNRNHYFGEIINGEMAYSPIGQFAHQSIKQIELLHGDIKTPVFQVMPNHIHILFVVIRSQHYQKTNEESSLDNGMTHIANQCGRMSHVIARFKSAVTKYSRQHNIDFGWQSRFHDHIIRDLREWDLITNYIKNNVDKWEQKRHV